MKKLENNGTYLEGKIIFNNGKIELDKTGKRIEFLIRNDLIKIDSDSSGWFILYQDKNDKRYWELSYPNSDIQGGGNPVLKNVNYEDIIDRYKI